ncbi:MAG: Ldh family oxidoreductase [Pseudomonadota bacterium]
MTQRLAPRETVEAWLASIFAAAGCPKDEAGIIARNLVLADLSGHFSHGIARTARYVSWIGEGKLRPVAKVEEIMRGGALALLEGNRSFGQVVGEQAVALAAEIAAEQGVAVVGVRHSGHLGRIGHWAERLAEKGFWSMHWVSVPGSRLVAPFGAGERRISTNPVVVGVPRQGDEGPFLLDFATSRVAEGKVLVALQQGKPLPKDAMVDEAGDDSDRPVTLYGETAKTHVPDPRMGPGALQTMGQHKGSGLALACELLAGALVGSGTNADMDAEICNGMLSIAMDPARFGEAGAIGADVEAFVDYIRASAPRGEAKMMIPGDPERAERARGAAEGVILGEGLYGSLVETSGRVGVSVPVA